MKDGEQKALKICRYFNATFLVILALYFFLIPAATVISDLSDTNVHGPGIPRCAWRLHRTLSPKYERWARERLNSSRATQLTTENISGTEWPLFGSVFYLWATESMQEAWDKEGNSYTMAPKVYAREAIEAATQLVIDPKQANWLQLHWGTNYLSTQNVFYRMLVVSALTCHAQLTGSTNNLPLLRDQVDGMAAELDTSPSGLLDDYPGECYPGDVLTMVAMIHRADKVLGSDHSAFIERAQRGFQGVTLDPKRLVPYTADPKSGRPSDWSRGCGNSYVSLFSPEIWPEQARQWYDLYSKHFWQEVWTAVGFREYPSDYTASDWHMDVDAGPVVKGFGFAACAFGLGAARVNGHFEQAYPLTAETLAVGWPLPNGTYLVPRMLSDAADAPLLGEAGILFNLTCQPVKGVDLKSGGSIPGFVYIILSLQMGIGLLIIVSTVRSLRRWRKQQGTLEIHATRAQLTTWVLFLVTFVVLLACDKGLLAGVCLMTALLFPRYRRTTKLGTNQS